MIIGKQRKWEGTKMLQAVNYLTSILRGELENSTGIIHNDKENGSYFRIRKLVTAIRALSDNSIDCNVKMEFQVETWQVIIEEPHSIDAEKKLYQDELRDYWKQKNFNKFEVNHLNRKLG